MRSYYLLALAGLLACDAPKPVEPNPGSTWPGDVPFAFDDAGADTLGTGGASTPALDAIRLSGRVEATVLVLELQFAAPVTPWSGGAANRLDGYVDFDLDESVATGIPAAVDEFGGAAQLGSDYYLSLRDNGQGMMALVNSTTRTFVPVAATFAGTTVTVRISRAQLPDADDGFGMAAVFGVADRAATDFVPNAGHLTVHRS